jgi:hypothetical protein
LATDVQQMLLEFGVVARRYRHATGEYKVVITNRAEAELFATQIGFGGATRWDVNPLLGGGSLIVGDFGLRFSAARVGGVGAQEGDWILEGPTLRVVVGGLAREGEPRGAILEASAAGATDEESLVLLSPRLHVGARRYAVRAVRMFALERRGRPVLRIDGESRVGGEIVDVSRELTIGRSESDVSMTTRVAPRDGRTLRSSTASGSARRSPPPSPHRSGFRDDRRVRGRAARRARKALPARRLRFRVGRVALPQHERGCGGTRGAEAWAHALARSGSLRHMYVPHQSPPLRHIDRPALVEGFMSKAQLLGFSLPDCTFLRRTNRNSGRSGKAVMKTTGHITVTQFRHSVDIMYLTQGGVVYYFSCL